MSLNPEKMRELKEKYNISDEDMLKIADSVEPEYEPEESETPIMGIGAPRTRSSEEPLSTTLSSVMKGDLSIAEAIILMDFLDRRDRRDQERNQPRQSSDTDRIMEKIQERIDEAEKRSREDREYFEKLLLGKKTEEAEERATRAESELKKRDESEFQRKMVEDAIDQALEKVQPELKDLREKVSHFTPTQQKGFWDEVFSEVGDEIKQDVTGQIMKRLRGEEEKETAPVTDKEGKPVINWQNVLNRLIKVGEKYVDAIGKAPPKLPIREVPPPLSETSQGETLRIEPEAGKPSVPETSFVPEFQASGDETPAHTPETTEVKETTDASQTGARTEEDSEATVDKPKGEAKKSKTKTKANSF